MMRTPQELFCAHLDGGELTRTESQRLSHWVSEDPRNAEKIMRLSYIHEYLDGRMCVTEMLEELAHSEDEEIRAEISHSLDALWRAVEESSPVVSPRSDNNSLSNGVLIGVAATIAALFVAMVGFSLWVPSSDPGNQPVAARPAPAASEIASGDNAQAGAQGSATTPAERPAKIAGTIEALIDAEWSKPTPLKVGGDLLQNEIIDIRQGIVQIRTNVGHTVVVEGPARFKFASAQQFTVYSGKIVGRVGQHSGSLECLTPGAKIVDLGTEFGVRVSDSNSTSVVVYDGAVEVQGRRTQDASKLAVAAGLQTSVDSLGTLKEALEESPHDREFVRPDEVSLRIEGAAGEEKSAAIAAYYQLVRSGQVLAYQGFDSSSRGEKLAVGFRSPAVRSDSRFSMAADLRPAGSATSGSVLVSKKGLVFLDLDTSSRSRLAAAGLVNKEGLVGQSGKELWIAWRSKSSQAAPLATEFAGLSLTVSDTEDDHDVFVGRISGISAVGMQFNHGKAAGGKEARKKFPIDFNPSAPGQQTRDVDGQPHQWLVRIRFEDNADVVSVWWDKTPEEAMAAAPILEQENSRVEFDRIRLGIGAPGVAWGCDELLIASSAEQIGEAMRLMQGDPPRAQ